MTGTRNEALRRRWIAGAAGLLAAFLTGCHGPGPYGHSPHYAEVGDETAFTAGAREFDPVMVLREPEQWRKGKVMLFGVVEHRTPGPGGQAMLKLSVHRLEPRNLCENENDDDSCRVTVSDKDFGVVYALIRLRGEDDVGPKAVGERSLIRLVGMLGQDVSSSDGAPIIHADFYRHWPAFYYVTNASASSMRQ